MFNPGAVVFNGSGYADKWKIEASIRRPQNLRTTLDAPPESITDDSMELFSHSRNFNHQEKHSRSELALNQCVLAFDVEAAVTLKLANTVIIAATLRWQTELTNNISS